MTHCIHYGTCGGCAVDSLHAIDKFSLLASALSRAGYPDAPIAPLVETPLHTRRRVDLAVTRKAGIISLGLHKTRSAEVVDMQECVLLLPNILRLLPELRVLLRSLQALRSSGSVLINWLDHGPDILLRMDAEFTGPDRTKIIAFARAHKILRISVATGTDLPEPAIILAPPILTFSGVPVEPPPGGFLQPSGAGESAIITAVLAGLPKLTAKSRLVELYAGSGTLSFALAQHARVEAYEGDAAAVAAGQSHPHQQPRRPHPHHPPRPPPPPPATHRHGRRRRRHLGPTLRRCHHPNQFHRRNAVKKIIYISCNPEALITDATLLRRAGYALTTATPIDQFPFSENIESVVIFSK